MRLPRLAIGVGFTRGGNGPLSAGGLTRSGSGRLLAACLARGGSWRLLAAGLARSGCGRLLAASLTRSGSWPLLAACLARNCASPLLDISKFAHRREIVRRGLEHVFELCCRFVVPAHFEESAAERDPG